MKSWSLNTGNSTTNLMKCAGLTTMLTVGHLLHTAYTVDVPVVLERVVKLENEGVVHLHQQPPLVHDVVLCVRESKGVLV